MATKSKPDITQKKEKSTMDEPVYLQKVKAVRIEMTMEKMVQWHNTENLVASLEKSSFRHHPQTQRMIKNAKETAKKQWSMIKIMLSEI